MICQVAMGDEPQAVPMPEVVEPAEDRLVVGVVHRVIDGDSVELFLNGRVVVYELAGADAPEVLDGRDVVLRGSVEAKAYLVGLVDGEQIAVLPDARRPTDARGRRRGYLYRMPDRLFVNLEMVRLGHAKHARDPMGFNHPVMEWAQGRARDAHKGVWARMPVTVTPVPLVTGSEAAGGSTGDEPLGTGDTLVEPAGDAGDASHAGADGLVYVTKFGSKYHTKDCRHVHDSAIAKRRDELDDSYSACKVCKPDEPDEE